VSEAVNKCPFLDGFCSKLIVNACRKQEELALKYTGKTSRKDPNSCEFSAGRAIYPEDYIGGSSYIGIKCGDCKCCKTGEEYAEWDGKCRYQKEPGKWEVYHNEKSCKHKSL
jgi:hypothetical protein